MLIQRIGTPLEDAERRDITINTLFYNVHTQSVEDWTGKVRRQMFVLNSATGSLLRLFLYACIREWTT
jgi:hypothetical protein